MSLRVSVSSPPGYWDIEICNHMGCSPPGSSVHNNSPGKNAGVGSCSLLQGIFPTQGSNPGLPYCRWILYHLTHHFTSLCPPD